MFHDVLGDAREQLPSDLDESTPANAHEAVEQALSDLMMLADGVPGGLSSGGGSSQGTARSAQVALRASCEVGEEVAMDHRFLDGDGAYMGLQFWCEGEFGKDPDLATNWLLTPLLFRTAGVVPPRGPGGGHRICGSAKLS